MRVEVSHHVRGRRRYNDLIENFSEGTIEGRWIDRMSWAGDLWAKELKERQGDVEIPASQFAIDRDHLITKRGNSRFQTPTHRCNSLIVRFKVPMKAFHLLGQAFQNPKQAFPVFRTLNNFSTLSRL
jgi:hypothetical protein